MNTSPDERKLRRFVLFFVALLAVPGGILAWHTYDQLKWQTFFQFNQQAAGFARELNQRLSAFIAIESARHPAEYASDAAISPLTQPPDTDRTGIVGYFSVQADGQIGSPLLNEKAPDRDKRLARWQEMTRILAGRPQEIAPSSSAPPPTMPAEKQKETRRTSRVLEEKAMLESEVSQDASLYDRLTAQSAPEERPERRSLGKLKDIELADRYQQKIRQKAYASKKESVPSPAPSVTEDSDNTSQAGTLATPPAMQKAEASNALPLVTRLFDTSVAPFRLRILANGYWVLFRTVQSAHTSTIQGLILSPGPFLDQQLIRPFQTLPLAPHSALIVADQNDIITAYSGKTVAAYRNPRRAVRSAELSGEILLQTTLVAPFSDLQIVVSIQDLPESESAPLVGYTVIAFLLTLVTGGYFFWRQGRRQIQLLRQQRDFVSAVSHELKTPLTSIRMYSELLRQGWVSAEKQHEYYAFIHDESERLTRLINNVLQLARLERNAIPTSLRRVSLGELLDMIHSRVKARCEETHTSLHLAWSHDTTEQSSLETDPDLVLQIILNLVDNAIKFSKLNSSPDTEGSTVRIDLEAAVIDDQAILAIRDYGPGIPDNERRKIFELFYRVENEMTRRTTGTGIGLALVARLAPLIHARVTVENASPGARFQVCLPLDEG